MKIITSAILCALMACEWPPLEKDAMPTPIKGIPGTVVRTEPLPDATGGPATPADQGWANQNAGGQPTVLSQDQVNGIVKEPLALIRMLGFELTDERDQLSQALEYGRMVSYLRLPLISGDDADTDRVAVADASPQFGRYWRRGEVVVMRFEATWTNANPTLDAMQAHVDLPFESAAFNSVAFLGYGSLPAHQLVLPSDAGPIGTTYAARIAQANHARAALESNTIVGAPPGVITVGDGDTEGTRVVGGEIVYLTNGVRNTRWPYVAWTSITHEPISSPSPTLLDLYYDGAIAADTIEVRQVAGDVLVDSWVLGAGEFPKGRRRVEVTASGAHVVRLVRTAVTRAESAQFEVDP